MQKEPNDWSNELAAIDIEVKRLKWSRDDEVKFLEVNFNYNNRNKITKYSELVNYLNMIKLIDSEKSQDLNNNTIVELIEESELILKELCWDHKRGREYLQKEFNVSTRKELNESELILFVSKLKSIRNKI